MQYYVILLSLYFLSMINLKNKKIEEITFIIMALFLCASYFNGSDWRQYELYYNLITFENFKEIYFEKGYVLYNLIFKYLKIDFFEMFIFTKIIIILIFKKIIFKYSENKYLTMGLFFSFMGIFLFIDCPFRNLIAIGIVLYAQKYLTKSKIKYILFIIMASLFHNSAIIFILLIIKLRKTFKKEILFIIIILIFIFLSNDILLSKLLSYMPFYDTRIIHYLGSKYDEGKIISVGSLEKILIIFLLLVTKKTKIINKKIIYYSIIYFLLYRIGLTFKFLARYAFYFQLFYLVALSNIIMTTEKIKQKIIITLVFGYAMLQMITVIHKNYEYLPYTTYMSWLFKEKPSYSYRFKYNLIKYIRKNGNNEGMKKRFKYLEEIEKSYKIK